MFQVLGLRDHRRYRHRLLQGAAYLPHRPRCRPFAEIVKFVFVDTQDGFHPNHKWDDIIAYLRYFVNVN